MASWYARHVDPEDQAAIRAQIGNLQRTLGDQMSFLAVSDVLYVLLPHPMYLVRFPGFTPSAAPKADLAAATEARYPRSAVR